jgi:integrase
MIRLHDLRHGWATLALQAGVHPKVVQERLGHANIGITLDTYSHVTAGLHDDAAERVAALFVSNPLAPGTAEGRHLAAD